MTCCANTPCTLHGVDQPAEWHTSVRIPPRCSHYVSAGSAGLMSPPLGAGRNVDGAAVRFGDALVDRGAEQLLDLGLVEHFVLLQRRRPASPVRRGARPSSSLARSAASCRMRATSSSINWAVCSLNSRCSWISLPRNGCSSLVR